VDPALESSQPAYDLPSKSTAARFYYIQVRVILFRIQRRGVRAGEQFSSLDDRFR